LTVKSAQDIKAYLVKHGQELNAQRGAETFFLEKKDLQARLLELADDAERSDVAINASYRNSAYKQVNKINRTKIADKLDKENKAEYIEQMKKEGVEKILFTVANLTSYIFFNLSNNVEAWAGMFGKSFGQLDLKNLLADKEKNKDTLMSHIGNYLLENLSLSFAKT